jgi:hypothetical protein
VRRDQGGDALGPHHGLQQPHDLPAGLRVQLAGRLVGDQQFRAPGQRPGDGHPLLLAAGQLVRPLRGVVLHADDVEQRGLAAAARASAGQWR